MEHIDTVIVLIGNDCTGKTTITREVNRLNSNVYALERSTQPIGQFETIHNLINFKQIDKLTLMTTIKEEYYNYEFLENIGNIKICYVVLDSNVNTLIERANKRSEQEKEIFEEEKALLYFKQRFLALASYFGFAVVSNENCNIINTTNEILRLVNSNEYLQIKSCGLKYLNFDIINSRLYENEIYLNDSNFGDVYEKTKLEIQSSSFLNEIYESEIIQINNSDLCETFKINLMKRYVCNNTMQFNEDVLNKNVPYFKLVTEGESKQVFEIISNSKYLNFYIIVLKPTIYSHSKQACGEIKDLEKVRASGTQLILEMLWRNNCKHTYYAMNNNGVAHSEIIETTPIEIVFKKYCIGTDKHSYYQMNKNNKCVITETGEYIGGPYIRFDWRNPNQVKDGIQLNSHQFYYLFESFIGKENFFNKYLKHQKSWGDKAVSEDILFNIFDVDESKKAILKVYNTIQYYCNEVGLETRDGCFMIDAKNNKIWSEINPDCMRIVGTDGTLYDKDIWREQGDEAKKNIITKWNSFNKIFFEYFELNPFIESELNESELYSYKFQKQILKTIKNKNLTISKKYNCYYTELLNDLPTKTNKINKSSKQNYKKDVVFTIDVYDKKPVLVKRGQIYTNHSNGNIFDALDKISIANNIFIADLNGAINGDNVINRKMIKEIATKYHVHTGGGVRSIEDIQDLLESSVRRVTIITNLNIISELPLKIRRDRLTVELSVNEHNKIMTHGRKVTTDINILDKINDLINLNVISISITFHQSEGMLNGLPKDQIVDLINLIPSNIEKIFIAGGISSIEDLHFLWNIPRVIPQLGSVVWKNILSVGQIIAEMGSYDSNGLIPAIIQSTTGKILGLIYMNKESIINTIDNKELWRFSRKYNKLMKKGEESGNTQKVLHVSYDCDNDSMLITLDSTNPFCHVMTGEKHKISCFNSQCAKFNIDIVNKWIEKSKSKYTTLMKKYSGLSYSKLLEEIEELWASKECGIKYLIKESSDVYVHFLMFLNSMNVSHDDIMNELGRKHYDPKLITTLSHKTYCDNNSDKIVIGITGDKYSLYTDKFIVEKLGIQIIRGIGRNLEINYIIVDQQKYEEIFSNKKVSFIGLKPKDMTKAVIYKLLHSVVAYNTTLDNLPTVFNIKIEDIENNISLCLIKRCDTLVDPSKWTPLNKGKIATEHTTSVTKYFTNLGINSDCYSLHKFLGSSESFLVNESDTKYDLCDAIVSSGKTLKENNLEIFDTILKPNEIKVVYAEMVKID